MRRRGGKHNEETRPRDRIHRYWVEIRQLSDGSVRTLQLRQKYPEDAYEGRLYWERDLEAEKRHRDALNGLISLIADSIVKEMLEARATARQTGVLASLTRAPR